MKKWWLPLSISLSLLFWTGMSFAQNPKSPQNIEEKEDGCPAHQLEKLGFPALAEMHKVIAPLWHKAYPEKNLKALKKAAPQLAEAVKKVSAVKPPFKDAQKIQAFEEKKMALIGFVGLYEKACKANDDKAVLELLPKIHNTYEGLAKLALESKPKKPVKIQIDKKKLPSQIQKPRIKKPNPIRTKKPLPKQVD